MKKLNDAAEVSEWHFWLTLGWVGLIVCLVGCAVGPKYTRPTASVPPTYKEATQSSGVKADNWKTAQPGDQVARGKWWEVFNDAQLNG